MKRLLILGFLVLASVVPGGMAAKADTSSISDYLGNYMYPLIMSAFTTRPDQSELYEFTMAGQKFRMPYSYIASSRLRPSGSTIHKGDGLHMTFLWPDLEPPTSENIEEFRRGPNNPTVGRGALQSFGRSGIARRQDGRHRSKGLLVSSPYTQGLPKCQSTR